MIEDLKAFDAEKVNGKNDAVMVNGEESGSRKWAVGNRMNPRSHSLVPSSYSLF